MGAISCLVHNSPEKTSPAKSKWKKLMRIGISTRKRVVSVTSSPENQVTGASVRREDRVGVITKEIEEYLGGRRSLQDLSNDYFDNNTHVNLILLNDLKDYINLTISINNCIEEINHEVSGDQTTDENNPLPSLFQRILNQRTKIRQKIQAMEEKNKSVIKRCKIWRKVIRIVSRIVTIVAIVGISVLSFVAPNTVPIATVCTTIVRPLEELMLSFWKKREEESKETIKLVDSIKESSVLEDPSMVVDFKLHVGC